MGIRTVLGFAAVASLGLASPLAAAGRASMPVANVEGPGGELVTPAGNAPICDPKTHLDAAGVRCKVKGAGSGNATWIGGALGVAALAALVVGVTNAKASP